MGRNYTKTTRKDHERSGVGINSQNANTAKWNKAHEDFLMQSGESLGSPKNKKEIDEFLEKLTNMFERKFEKTFNKEQIRIKYSKLTKNKNFLHSKMWTLEEEEYLRDFVKKNLDSNSLLKEAIESFEKKFTNIIRTESSMETKVSKIKKQVQEEMQKSSANNLNLNLARNSDSKTTDSRVIKNTSFEFQESQRLSSLDKNFHEEEISKCNREKNIRKETEQSSITEKDIKRPLTWTKEEWESLKECVDICIRDWEKQKELLSRTGKKVGGFHKKLYNMFEAKNPKTKKDREKVKRAYKKIKPEGFSSKTCLPWSAEELEKLKESILEVARQGKEIFFETVVDVFKDKCPNTSRSEKAIKEKFLDCRRQMLNENKLKLSKKRFYGNGEARVEDSNQGKSNSNTLEDEFFEFQAVELESGPSENEIEVVKSIPQKESNLTNLEKEPIDLMINLELGWEEIWDIYKEKFMRDGSSNNLNASQSQNLNSLNNNFYGEEVENINRPSHNSNFFQGPRSNELPYPSNPIRPSVGINSFSNASTACQMHMSQNESDFNRNANYVPQYNVDQLPPPIIGSMQSHPVFKTIAVEQMSTLQNSGNFPFFNQIANSTQQNNGSGSRYPGNSISQNPEEENQQQWNVNNNDPFSF